MDGQFGQWNEYVQGYTRDYDIVCKGKPVIKGSADPGYLGDAATAERLHERAQCHVLHRQVREFPGRSRAGNG